MVFDTDGTLLANYQKQHLFHEGQFSTPQKAKIVIFKTSFGVLFNVFTCFDMLFYDPAIELVEKFRVRNTVLFPTAWMVGFPILSRLSASMVTIDMCQSSRSQSAFPLGRYGREWDFQITWVGKAACTFVVVNVYKQETSLYLR